MEKLANALRATQSLLQPRPSGSSGEFQSKAFRDVFKTLGDNSKSVRERDSNFISALKHATSEVHKCEKNNKRAFKLVWNLYATTQQQCTHCPSIGEEDIRRNYDRVVPVLLSFLRAFDVHPFAVSPGDSFEEFATLNAGNDTAVQYRDLAERIGRAWVGDRLSQSDNNVRELGALQASIFELLWSGTIEQLKRHGLNDRKDPERLEFEKSLGELEKTLEEAVVRSKKKRFSIAFCGMVKAGKSLFLNGLIGRAILPSDGGSHSYIVGFSHSPCRTAIHRMALSNSPR